MDSSNESEVKIFVDKEQKKEYARQYYWRTHAKRLELARERYRKENERFQRAFEKGFGGTAFQQDYYYGMSSGDLPTQAELEKVAFGGKIEKIC